MTRRKKLSKNLETTKVLLGEEIASANVLSRGKFGIFEEQKEDWYEWKAIQCCVRVFNINAADMWGWII